MKKTILAMILVAAMGYSTLLNGQDLSLNDKVVLIENDGRNNTPIDPALEEEVMIPFYGNEETQVDSIGSCNACDNLPAGVFCDDFCGTGLNLEKWWYGRSQWGNGKIFKNNGIIPENVILKNNKVYFGANGDLYSGPLKGIRKNKAEIFQDQSGKRVGGNLITDEYFGSGKYEVRMKVPPKLGVCTAIWTFHYQELYPDNPEYDKYVAQGLTPQGNEENGYYVTVNHEIDIEIPTNLKGQTDKEISYRNARLNTWIGEENYTDDFHDMGFEQNDGKFHTYRFDWHTGGNGQEARVEFYVDDSLMHTCTTNIPNIKGRLTLGTWFPQWAGGKADFDRIFLEVDWVKITPFNEPNDKIVKETYKNSGMTKCQSADENNKFLKKCRLATF
jgi:beta-glucanase (GH16 family)